VIFSLAVWLVWLASAVVVELRGTPRRVEGLTTEGVIESLLLLQLVQPPLFVLGSRIVKRQNRVNDELSRRLLLHAVLGGVVSGAVSILSARLEFVVFMLVVGVAPMFCGWMICRRTGTSL
jgi:hypothetical protein